MQTESFRFNSIQFDAILFNGYAFRTGKDRSTAHPSLVWPLGEDAPLPHPCLVWTSGKGAPCLTPVSFGRREMMISCFIPVSFVRHGKMLPRLAWIISGCQTKTENLRSHFGSSRTAQNCSYKFLVLRAQCLHAMP